MTGGDLRHVQQDASIARLLYFNRGILGCDSRGRGVRVLLSIDSKFSDID